MRSGYTDMIRGKKPVFPGKAQLAPTAQVGDWPVEHSATFEAGQLLWVVTLGWQMIGRTQLEGKLQAIGRLVQKIKNAQWIVYQCFG